VLKFEKEATQNGFRFIFGVDEAGCGPLAGPVVAAAVYLPTLKRFKNHINDSKQMTPETREDAFHEIYERAFVGVGIMSETAIDQINILNAAHLAMEHAVMNLTRRMPQDLCGAETFAKDVIMLIDGNRFKSELPYQHKTIVEGDTKSLSIACASIIAKVTRDRMMEGYHQVFPQYGFKDHKGYATSEHREAIKRHGPSRLHRRSFTLI
jgi:ribonuclease HII